MIKKGLSLKEIALERDMVLQTVEGHVATLVEKGAHIDLSKYVQKQKCKELCEKLKGIDTNDKLSDTRIKVGKIYSYFEIKIALALNKTNNPNCWGQHDEPLDFKIIKSTKIIIKNIMEKRMANIKCVAQMSNDVNI